MKTCECGCGESTNVITMTNRRKGLTKGEYRRFIWGHQARIAEAIEDKYAVDLETGCWNWLRAQDGHGYGQYLHPETKRNIHPHRFLYERERGPIPNKMVVDHLCRNRLCVNPAHMEAVSNRENIRRGLIARATSCRPSESGSG